MRMETHLTLGRASQLIPPAWYMKGADELPLCVFFLLTVRENASFGRSDDVTILLFRSKIAKKKREKI